VAQAAAEAPPHRLCAAARPHITAPAGARAEHGGRGRGRGRARQCGRAPKRSRSAPMRCSALSSASPTLSRTTSSASSTSSRAGSTTLSTPGHSGSTTWPQHAQRVTLATCAHLATYGIHRIPNSCQHISTRVVGNRHKNAVLVRHPGALPAKRRAQHPHVCTVPQAHHAEAWLRSMPSSISHPPSGRLKPAS